MEMNVSRLAPSIIKNIDFDIIGHQISIVLAPAVDISTDLHELVFSGVTAFYFIDKSSSFRTAGQSADYLPFEDLLYRPGKVYEIILKDNAKPNGQNFDAFPNFLLEMWDTTVLFIEANEVSIDGQRIGVPYPIPFIDS